MTEFVTVFRFFTTASLALLGDGLSVSVIGWSPEQSQAGVDLAELGQAENGLGRIGYVFHSATAVPPSAQIKLQQALGFHPTVIEMETFTRASVIANGGRAEWFDVAEATASLVDSRFVLFPDSDETRNLFRAESRGILGGGFS